MTIRVGDIPVNCECFGEGGENVVILQGWGTAAPLYRDMAAHLGKTMRVWLPELPGFGETPEPKEPMDAEDYAAFVLELLRALGIRETHLIGHSNGGRIMLVLASEPRDVRFGKLVFLDSAGVRAPLTAKKKLKTAAYKVGRRLLAPFPAALEKYRRSHGSADYRAASPVMRRTLVKLVSADLTDRMPGIKNPSLLIWGTEDGDTPLWMARVFEEKIPDAGLVTVEGAGHYAYLERPGYVYPVLDAFFGGK